MRKVFLKNDQNFRECIEILNKLKIDYWICHGTLLGLIRDKSLIPWDNDIDIGTWNINNKNLIINSFIKRGFVKQKKIFGNNYLISFKKGNNRIIDINFYETDTLRKICFQRHYAIRNIFCRLVYVLSTAKSYKGRFKSIINFFYFLEKNFKKIKLNLIKMKLFYIDAGFETKIKNFKYLRVINYYSLKIKIPIFYNDYFNDIYGKSWRVPDRKYYWEKNKNKKILQK